MPGKPPVHFSDKDPWKNYRVALRRAERPRLQPPVHYSKHGARAHGAVQLTLLSRARAPGHARARTNADPWREYRFALRRATERLKTGLAPDDYVEDTGLIATARNSLGGSSSYRGTR